MPRPPAPVKGVYQRADDPSGNWYTRLRIDGKLVKKSFGRDRAAAIDYVEKARTLRRAGEGYIPTTAKGIPKTAKELELTTGGSSVLLRELCDDLLRHIQSKPNAYKDQRNPLTQSCYAPELRWSGTSPSNESPDVRDEPEASRKLLSQKTLVEWMGLSSSDPQLIDIRMNWIDQIIRSVRAARERSRRLCRELSNEERGRVAQSALTFARDRGFEREAVLDERAILRDALRRGMGEVIHADIRANFDARVTSGEFRAVTADKHGSGRRFTTAATISAEKEIVRKVLETQGRGQQIMTVQQAISLTETRSYLNPAQRRTIEEVLTSRDQIQGVQGVAGSGKTTTLESIRWGAEQSGYIVEGFAPTSRAAHQLRNAGINADTLQRFLASGARVDVLEQKHLYMVDESSFASTQQMRDFLRRLATQDRVLLIGDTRQHQGVDAGKPFEQFQQAGMRTAQLDQILRQRDPELRRAVEHLSRAETSDGIDLLRRRGRISEIADTQQRIATIAKHYAESPQGTLIISPDNDSRRAINQAVRKELQSRELISRAEHSLRVLVPRNDMTGADRRWAACYQVGDVLHYSKGSKEFGLERSSYAWVMATGPELNLLTVERQDGERVTYNPARLRGISAYAEKELDFAVGDRIAFTAPNRALGVANRDLGSIRAIADNGRFTVRMDDLKKKLIDFDAREMRHLDHGYAVTSHSSQGLTSERVLVNMDTEVHPELVNSRFAYVSISRASHDAQIFTNDSGSLAVRLSHDVTKESAVDLVSKPVASVTLQPLQRHKHATEVGLGLGI